MVAPRVLTYPWGCKLIAIFINLSILLVRSCLSSVRFYPHDRTAWIPCGAKDPRGFLILSEIVIRDRSRMWHLLSWSHIEPECFSRLQVPEAAHSSDSAFQHLFLHG